MFYSLNNISYVIMFFLFLFSCIQGHLIGLYYHWFFSDGYDELYMSIWKVVQNYLENQYIENEIKSMCMIEYCLQSVEESVDDVNIIGTYVFWLNVLILFLYMIYIHI